MTETFRRQAVRYEKGDEGEWRVRRRPPSLLALLDEIRAEAAGVTTIDDVRGGWIDPDRE